MKVISWNLAYWKPAHFKSRENRCRQWTHLLALEPDIVLLQECRPTDFERCASKSAQEEYSVFGAARPKGGACSAILARKALRPTQDADPDSWLDLFGDYVSRVRLHHPTIGEVRVASVHAIAQEVKFPTVTDADHTRIKRTGCKRAWHNDLAAHALRGWAEGAEFLIGGDWNTARAFDLLYDKRWPNAGHEFFEVTKCWGWCESLRKFHDGEIQTYFDRNPSAYELDHLFTSERLHQQLKKCDALTDSIIREVSDHAPIVADFKLGKIVAPSNRFSDWSAETVTITKPTVPPAVGDKKA